MTAKTAKRTQLPAKYREPIRYRGPKLTAANRNDPQVLAAIDQVGRTLMERLLVLAEAAGLTPSKKHYLEHDEALALLLRICEDYVPGFTVIGLPRLGAKPGAKPKWTPRRYISLFVAADAEEQRLGKGTTARDVVKSLVSRHPQFKGEAWQSLETRLSEARNPAKNPLLTTFLSLLAKIRKTEGDEFVQGLIAREGSRCEPFGPE